MEFKSKIDQKYKEIRRIQRRPIIPLNIVNKPKRIKRHVKKDIFYFKRYFYTDMYY